MGLQQRLSLAEMQRERDAIKVFQHPHSHRCPRGCSAGTGQCLGWPVGCPPRCLGQGTLHTARKGNSKHFSCTFSSPSSLRNPRRGFLPFLCLAALLWSILGALPGGGGLVTNDRARGFPSHSPADRKCPTAKNFKLLCAEITVPLSFSPCARRGKIPTSLRSAQEWQSQQTWNICGNKKRGWYVFPHVIFYSFPYFIPYVAFYMFYLWEDFYVILFPPGGWGSLLGFPGMQTGLSWFPVAGGVLGISKGVLQVCHLPRGILRRSWPGNITARPPGCPLGRKGSCHSGVPSHSTPG